jgi:gluconolactonase
VSQVHELAAGIGFTEGPLWTSDERLLVTSVSRGQVCEVDLDGGGVVARIETGGGPNGLAEDDEGRIWVAQNGGLTMPSRSTRPVVPGLQELSAGVRDVATPGVLGPNDLVAGPDGRIWFTDPGGKGHDGRPAPVRAHDPATGTTECVADGIAYPNGLAFDPAGESLHVAETRTGAILRYARDGRSLHPLGRFAALPEGGPDGLAVDDEGVLLAAAPEADAIFRFAPDGRALTPVRFDRPTFPTNLCFAGPALDVLVVTAAKGGRVLAVEGVGRGLGSRVGSRSGITT